MPEGEGQGPGNEQSGAGAGQQQQQQQQQGGTGGDQGLFDGPYDEARARALIDKLRPLHVENRELQQRLEEAQGRITEFENAGRTELERAQGKVTELEGKVADLTTQLKETRLRGAFQAAATKAGALYPDSVWKLADLESVEFDTDGTPKNLEPLLEGLKQAYPAMFGQPVRGNGSADGGIQGSGAQGGADINDWIRGAAGRR